MKKIYALGFIVAAGLMQVTSANADDYENGQAAGYNGYYGGKPDNNSSADYVQGYNHGQYQQQQNSNNDE
jgi:hypothetical protein